MAYVKVAALRDVPVGEAVQIAMGDGAVAVCNVGGTVHAIDGVCPHAGGPLGDGALHGTTLVCPYHAWGFDCITGESDMHDNLRQALYPVKVEDGAILVDLPATDVPAAGAP